MPETIERRLATIEFAGRTFRLDSAGGTDQVAAKIQAGSYEAPLPMLVSAMLSRLGGLFLDVGANTGVYAVIAALTRPDVRVLAFEPLPAVLDLLRANILLNALEDRIKILEIALGDTDGHAAIFLPDPQHGLVETSASLQRGFIANASPFAEVRVQRLDDLDLGGVATVAKVDIEGFELEFLRGAEATLRSHRPVVFAEMMSASVSKFSEISRLVGALHYLPFRLRTDAAILTSQIRFDDQAWNYALVPEERMPLMREVCAFHQLELLAPF